jgi:hypothetical protein
MSTVPRPTPFHPYPAVKVLRNFDVFCYRVRIKSLLQRSVYLLMCGFLTQFTHHTFYDPVYQATSHDQRAPDPTAHSPQPQCHL